MKTDVIGAEAVPVAEGLEREREAQNAYPERELPLIRTEYVGLGNS